MKQIMVNFVKTYFMQATSAFDVDEREPAVLLRTYKAYFWTKFDLLVSQKGSRLTKDVLHLVQKMSAFIKSSRDRSKCESIMRTTSCKD